MNAIIITDSHFRNIITDLEMIVDNIRQNYQLIVLGDFSDEPKNILTLKALKEIYNEKTTIFPGNHENAYTHPDEIIDSMMFHIKNKKFEDIKREVKKSRSFEFLKELVKKNKKAYDEGKLQEITVCEEPLLAYHSAPDIFNENKDYENILWERMKTSIDVYDYSKFEKLIRFMEEQGKKGLLRGHDHEMMIATKKKDGKMMKIYTTTGTYQKNGLIEKINNNNLIYNPVTLEDEEIFIFNPGAHYNGYYGLIEREKDQSIKLSIKHPDLEPEVYV